MSIQSQARSGLPITTSCGEDIQVCSTNAQSWIGTVWSKFGTGRQSSYSKAGTWLNQSVSSQVWALDGIIKAGVHKKQQTIKGTSWPPHSAWQTHRSLPKESLLFGKWWIGCGDVVPCMAERSQDRKTERKANSEGRSWQKIGVWSTPVMPETLTKKERQSLPDEVARGSQQAYSLTSRPTS